MRIALVNCNILPCTPPLSTLVAYGFIEYEDRRDAEVSIN